MANEKIIKGRQQQKYDVKERWEEAGDKGFIPKAGEIIVYSDLNKIKIGDGKTNINDLGFMQTGTTSGSGQGSIIIGLGTASGENSVVIGSGEASGTGATAIGGGTATGDYSVAEGRDTLAGCKGYYIAAIDPTNRHIYLHTGKDDVIPTWDNPSNYYNTTFNSGYQILNDSDNTLASYIPYGNEFSIGSDGYYHWAFTGNIIEISGNRITYGENNSLNNTDKWINENNKYDGQVDPMIFFIPAQSNCGVTNVGLGSHAEGWLTHAAAQHSHAEGEGSIVAGRYGHAEGRQTRAGFAAHAEGQNTLAKGLYSHAEGANTTAIGSGTHAEGSSAVAIGNNSHAEGAKVVALGVNSHAEGRATNKATDIIPNLSSDTSFDEIKAAWDENKFSLTIKEGSHVEGVNNIANAYGHAEGGQTIAKGAYSHAEGQKNIASGTNSHVEGTENEANGNNSHAEGKLCFANGEDSHAEGLRSIANKKAQHVQGRYNIADDDNSSDYGKYAHIVGNGTSDTKRSNAYTLDWDGNAQFAGEINALGFTSEGFISGADGYFSTMIETPVIDDGMGCSITVKDIALKSDLSTEKLGLVGKKTENNGEIFNNYNGNKAEDKFSHAEGSLTTAVGESSHAEGLRTTALGIYSHAEGRATNKATDVITDFTSAKKYSDYTINGKDTLKQAWDGTKFSLAIGECAHSEGVNTIAGSYAHAEGEQTIASGSKSHAEGTKTQAKGTSSHAEGEGTVVNKRCQHVQGKYNIEDTSTNTYGKYADIVGNGTSSKPSNAYTLDWDGNAWFAGNVYVGGDNQDNGKRLLTEDDLSDADIINSIISSQEKMATDIDSALDSILAIQNQLIGGDAE